MARSSRACGWWPARPRGPAWGWRQRGVRRDEHEVELRVAPGVLAMLPLAGRLVRGDALCCQRHLCAQIVAAKGGHRVIVKENQAQLYADIALLFDDPPPGEVFATAEQREQHGNRREERRLWASTGLRGYLDWRGPSRCSRSSA